MPISGTARLDAGAHDWPHRHAAATRTIRQATDTTTLTSCPPPPTGPWSWPAAVDYSTVHTPVPLLFSPVSPAPRRRRRRRARAAVSGSLLLLQDSILPPSTATTTSLSKRSARPQTAARRQLHFGLRCAAALVPHGSSCSSLVLYTSDACMQPTMQATRRQAQPRRPSAHSAWPLSCLSRPSRFAHRTTTTSGSASRGRWTTRIMGAYPS